MRQLLDFLYQYRETGLFFILEILCFWLLIGYNRRYNASFLNSSNELAAFISQTSGNISNYFELAEINKKLIRENQDLKQKLSRLNQDSLATRDTLKNRYLVTSSRVISNSFRRDINFLTISGGSKNNIEPGMGVISADGVVGQVKSVSENFSTVYSLLHPKLLVSSRIKRTDTKTTVQWDQRAYDRASLKYIPRHILIKKGDSVVTSGFNSVFPPGILVGVVDEFSLSEEMTFYEAKIKLSTDFTSLSNVYVIRDMLKQVKDSLQQI